MTKNWMQSTNDYILETELPASNLLLPFNSSDVKHHFLRMDYTHTHMHACTQ